MTTAVLTPRSLAPFALLLFAACGGSATVTATETTAEAVEVAATPPPPEPMDYLPADTVAVVTVDVARLRSSPYYPMVVDAAKSTDELDTDEEEALHRLVERTSKVWFTVGPRTRGEGLDLGVILFEGDYDPGQPEETLRTVVPRPEELQEVEIAGHHALAASDAVLAQIDDRHWIMGPDDRIGRVLESPPGGIAAASEPAWAEAKSWLRQPNTGITVMALGTPEVQRELQRETPMDPQTAASVRSAAFAFDAEDGLFVEAMFLMADPTVAAQVVSWLQVQLDELAQSMIAGMLGLSGVIRSVDARAEGMVAGARVTVPDAEVRRLLGALPNLLAQ